MFRSTNLTLEKALKKALSNSRVATVSQLANSLILSFIKIK